MDGRGVPLSLVVTGANRHDVSQLGAVLKAIMVERPNPAVRRHKHLCADAGYTGAPALKAIEEHGYIPHVKGRAKEAEDLKRTPAKRAKRWIVEVAHSWFNRFRKLLVRYEKLDREPVRNFVCEAYHVTKEHEVCRARPARAKPSRRCPAFPNN